ncbi:polysaccharide biosynthesis C-terminal domain-containing protein [uncultured Rhodoblastus sp.]|uniref:lipopolysaccharide biosynthesis protein n=1 Tax=uncultured Rhodoblastus sp. TaxID=543037 RepID=UPI0025E8B68B|nr:polysaccharide biosynthesis C-terminal domain-containing protein [uncultured Rhodoblastus sp.]
MLMIVTFALNAGLNFALGLAVAAILGPDAFGRFALALIAATLGTTVIFDWLRLSATRYYSENARFDRPGLRASLDAGYVAGALVLAGAAGLVVALRIDIGMSGALVAAAAFAAIGNGLFEFAAALLRARFRTGAYGALVIVKNALAFLGMVAIGLAFHDPAGVLATAGASALLATLLLRRHAHDPHARLAQASREQVAACLRYGAPIVAANMCYQAILLVNRGAAAAHLDFAASGRLSLATDLTIRFLLVAGAALDILLFQLAVHKKATEGAQAAQAQVARNSLVILAALTLLCSLYMANLPAFAALVVPEKFRAEFAPLSLILAPGATLFCLGQFCLNPIAQLEGRTGLILLAAFAAALADFGLLWLSPQPLGLAGFAAIHSIALTAGFLPMLALTLRWRACWPRPRDVVAILFAGAAAMAVMWPLREFEPRLPALAVGTLAGATVYAALLFVFDPGGIARPAFAKIRLWRRRDSSVPTPLCKGEPT